MTLSCAFAACSVYDAKLSHATASVRDRRDASVDGSMARPDDHDARDAHEASQSDDDAGTSIPQSTTGTTCGDGRITGNETCDTGIQAGMPGACPTECPELAHCAPRALNNSGCQAECVVLPLICMSGDGCCPANCTGQNDHDCSSKCGDGVIEDDLGETCESESSTPCKTSDAQCDDGDACTIDKLVGNAKNCNALCMNTRIAAPENGDGCCLSGSDANTDNDCQPVCGNHVREAGEDCDGTAGCSVSCKLARTADQVTCLDKFANGGDECTKCSCDNCATSYLACRDSGDVSANALCTAVLECARAKKCNGTACYCGDAFLCAPADGMCKAEVEKAAASTDPNVILLVANDTTNPLGRATATGTCLSTQCSAQCH